MAVEREEINEPLSDLQFARLTQELICDATANGTLPCDALAALAKALGTLLAFAARREGLDEGEVLLASQNALADYAMAASTYMRENADADPALSMNCS